MAEPHRDLSQTGEPQAPRPGGPGGPGGLRASDAEREQVITQLQQHYVDGRITAEELSERTDHIYASRTRGALQVVLQDLPALGKPPATPSPVRAEAPPRRRRPPVLAIVLWAVTMMLLLRGLAWAVFGADGDFDGGPFVFPLFPILFMWIVFRAGRARS